MTTDHIKESAELKVIIAVSKLGLFVKAQHCDIEVIRHVVGLDGSKGSPVSWL